MGDNFKHKTSCLLTCQSYADYPYNAGLDCGSLCGFTISSNDHSLQLTKAIVCPVELPVKKNLFHLSYLSKP